MFESKGELLKEIIFGQDQFEFDSNYQVGVWVVSERSMIIKRHPGRETVFCGLKYLTFHLWGRRADNFRENGYFVEIWVSSKHFQIFVSPTHGSRIIGHLTQNVFLVSYSCK